MSDLAISYDLLFDILRYEKSREDMQSLDKDFFKKVVEYLKQKDASMLSINTPTTERELTRIQVNNIKKILQEIYDRRERKIINLALYKIKTGSEMINTSVLLEEERIMFDNLYLLFSKYNSSILDNILNHKMPFAENVDVQKSEKNQEQFFDPEQIVSIRFIKPVPKFLGPELDTYGPFEEQDIASMPYKIASILISKNNAEQIRSE
jgi:DNA replication factor GINS